VTMGVMAWSSWRGMTPKKVLILIKNTIFFWRIVIFKFLNWKNVFIAILDSVAILNFYAWQHFFLTSTFNFIKFTQITVLVQILFGIMQKISLSLFFLLNILSSIDTQMGQTFFWLCFQKSISLWFENK
jgi:hypothetical protein